MSAAAKTPIKTKSNYGLHYNLNHRPRVGVSEAPLFSGFRWPIFLGVAFAEQKQLAWNNKVRRRRGAAGWRESEPQCGADAPTGQGTPHHCSVRRRADRFRTCQTHHAIHTHEPHAPAEAAQIDQPTDHHPGYAAGRFDRGPGLFQFVWYTPSFRRRPRGRLQDATKHAPFKESWGPIRRCGVSNASSLFFHFFFSSLLWRYINNESRENRGY